MLLYVIYYNAADYPQKYVVRKSYTDNGIAHVDPVAEGVVDTLEQAKGLIPQNAVLLPRMPDELAQVEEAWAVD